MKNTSTDNKREEFMLISNPISENWAGLGNIREKQWQWITDNTVFKDDLKTPLVFAVGGCKHKWETKDECIDGKGKEYTVWHECKLCGEIKPYDNESP